MRLIYIHDFIRGYFNKKAQSSFMRTKGHIFAVPPHFAGRCRASALITLTVLEYESSIGSRYNGLTHTDLFFTFFQCVNFFCNQSERRSIAFNYGGFQPMTSPSLSDNSPFTLPGGDQYCFIATSVHRFKRGVNTDISLKSGYNIDKLYH